MKRTFKLFACLFALAASNSYACGTADTWQIPGSNNPQSLNKINEELQRSSIILLGEHHANESHHRWHIDVLNRITTTGSPVVLALEVFPRRHQPLLDQWVNGELSEPEFVRKLDWNHIWGFDIQLYLPLFRWARDHHTPIIALNVDKSLIQRIRDDGLHSIPMNEREGVSAPNKPTREYVAQLARSFREHGTQYDTKEKEQQAFLRFVEQQLFWDRAMADGISQAQSRFVNAKIVGIVGSWHLIRRQGVPYQMGGDDQLKTKVFVPWDEHLDCNELLTNFADWVYFPSGT